MVTDPKGEPKEVRIGGQHLERGSELLAQLLLVIGSRQGFPPALREVRPQFVEELVRERLKEVVAASEMLIEGCASDTGPLRHSAGGEAGLTAGQDHLPGGAE